MYLLYDCKLTFSILLLQAFYGKTYGEVVSSLIFNIYFGSVRNGFLPTDYEMHNASFGMRTTEYCAKISHLLQQRFPTKLE